MLKRVFALCCCALFSAPAFSRAGETSFGITLAGTHGTHREAGGTANAPLVPAPLLSASHAFNCLEVSAEGLPPVGPISVGNNGLGMQNVALTYADAGVRYWNRTHTFALGIGQTLYNQRTLFAAEPAPGERAQEIDRSRVTGTRYEIMARKPLSVRNFLEASLGVDPAMHGRFSYTQTLSGRSGPFNLPSLSYQSAPSWARAAQIDANARFVHRSGPYAISYGVRYLNYIAQFNGDFFRPRFADANSLVMPYVQVERFFASPDSTGQAVMRSCTPRVSKVDIEAFFGAQAFAGKHVDTVGDVRDRVVALPSLTLRARRNHYELLLEDMAAIGPISGTLHYHVPFKYNVRSGYADMALRYWEPSNCCGVGIGQSLYVDRLHYGNEYRAIRAAGMRYETFATLPLDARHSVALDFAFSPSMHERASYWLDNAYSIISPSFGVGSLVDASLQFETRNGASHSWIYGLRYLNYAGGMYRRRDPLAEHTGMLTGFAAWGLRLGP
jgi:hypothetical protein